MSPERPVPSGPVTRAGHTGNAAPHRPSPPDPVAPEPYVPLNRPPNPTVAPGSWKHP